jgi:hypothetical protein
MNTLVTNTNVSLRERINIQAHLQPGFWLPLAYLAKVLNEQIEDVQIEAEILAQANLIERRVDALGQAEYGRWTSATSTVARGASEILGRYPFHAHMAADELGAGQ